MFEEREMFNLIMKKSHTHTYEHRITLDLYIKQ